MRREAGKGRAAGEAREETVTVAHQLTSQSSCVKSAAHSLLFVDASRKTSSLLSHLVPVSPTHGP